MVKLDERYDLMTATVTLDGKPAQISGAKQDHAMVRTYPDGNGYSWSWDTVRDVVAKGGNFRS
jgi:hypothetical protein